MSLNIEEMATFCKKKGFVYRSADIYGGLSGFFDYGPLGVEVKNKLKQRWYKFIVQDRQNIVGQDGSIITNPKVWKASGHIDTFSDLILTTKKTKTKIRADHFIEDQLKISAEGMSAKEIQALITKHKLKHNKEDFEEIKDFNLMFSTQVGPSDESAATSYLRPETCQSIFPNFKLIVETTRQKLPFGIAQIGKAFRNEISPREFLFRQREFEQMELEFFHNPKEKECPELTKKHKDLKFQFLSAKTQDAKKTKMETVSVADIIKQKLITGWQAYWLAEYFFWYTEELQIDPKNIRVREHMKNELSHYSSATFDLDYKFPFGFKEIFGLANRGQFDLTQHQKHSKSKLEYFDETTKEKIIPNVIEPSQGIDRLFLALLFEAYNVRKDEKGKEVVVLKIPQQLAPYYCAILPLVKNKEAVRGKAKEVYEMLRKCYPSFYDEAASVGRRYARADEIGIPYCITIDFETLEDDAVTIRHRDTGEQERVKIKDLRNKLFDLYIY